MAHLYYDTNNPNAEITYRVSNGWGDQTTALERTFTYWNISLMSAMTQLKFDNSNVGAYGKGFNTIMI